MRLVFILSATHDNKINTLIEKKKFFIILIIQTEFSD